MFRKSSFQGSTSYYFPVSPEPLRASTTSKCIWVMIRTVGHNNARNPSPWRWGNNWENQPEFLVQVMADQMGDGSGSQAQEHCLWEECPVQQWAFQVVGHHVQPGEAEHSHIWSVMWFQVPGVWRASNRAPELRPHGLNAVCHCLHVTCPE